VEAAKMIKNKGANKVYACATHAVLSGKAKQLISDSPIEKVFISDTIHHSELPEKFEVVSIAGLLGEALMRVRKNLSVSILFR
jgi:ribose-phosphate pyrophosphokinase